MDIRRIMFLSGFLLATGSPVFAGEANSVPQLAPAEAGTYDPQLTAKEAALSNWVLAASGISAGKVVSDRVVAAYDKGMPYAELSEQAQFSLKTIVMRYNSADWLFASHTDLKPLGKSSLLSLTKASQQICDNDNCNDQRDAIRQLFAQVAQEFAASAMVATNLAKAQENKSDRALLSQSLTTMANYLRGTSWYTGLNLTEVGGDAQEISARLVGMLATWNNIEAYIGLTDAKTDDAVNAAKDALLREMRRIRRKPSIDPNGVEIKKMRDAANALAIELSKAAVLFKG